MAHKGAPAGNHNAKGTHLGHGRAVPTHMKGALQDRINITNTHLLPGMLLGGAAGHFLGKSLAGGGTDDEVAAGVLGAAAVGTVLNTKRLVKKSNAKHGVTDAQVADHFKAHPITPEQLKGFKGVRIPKK